MKSRSSMEEMTAVIRSMAAENHETCKMIEPMMGYKARPTDKPEEESKKVDSAKPRHNFK